MRSVNVSIDYAFNVMNFGHVQPGTTQVIANDTLLKSGIVSGSFLAPCQEKLNDRKACVYYLGCLIDCLLGGWIAEKIERIKGMALNSVWAISGAALQISAQNAP